MNKPVVFIAAANYQFDSAVKAEKFAREAGAEVLNPTVSLPCGLAPSCYLPIEVAMLEASDIIWVVASNYRNCNLRALVHYALAQDITIVTSEQMLMKELAKYCNYEQLIIDEEV